MKYEMQPCHEVGINDVEVCSPDKAEFWTIYRRSDDGMASAVCDCLTDTDAESAMIELISLSEEVVRLRGIIGEIRFWSTFHEKSIQSRHREIEAVLKRENAPVAMGEVA